MTVRVAGAVLPHGTRNLSTDESRVLRQCRVLLLLLLMLLLLVVVVVVVVVAVMIAAVANVEVVDIVVVAAAAVLQSAHQDYRDKGRVWQ